MFEIECAPGCEFLRAVFAAFKDCRHDLALARRLALAQCGDEGVGVGGGILCVGIARRLSIVASRRVVISRGFVMRVWVSNGGGSNVFSPNSRAVAHDR